MRVSKVAAGLAANVLFAEALTPCPILGPGYPAPRDVSSPASQVTKSWGSIISDTNSLLSGPVQGVTLSDYTFSIQAFSLKDGSASRKLQYHYTAPGTKNATRGVKNVDSDTMYRIGSISKLFTVYLTLIELGDAYWWRPVTDFIPQLAPAVNSSSFDPINSVDWRQVNLGALAGQISGVTRDIGDLTFFIGDGVVQAGFPPSNKTDTTNALCYFSNPNCTQHDFIQQVIDRPPTYASWTTPTYSNSAFGILAVALEAITGQKFEEMAKQSLLKPLGMNSSGLGIPSDLSHAVLANSNPSIWANFSGHEAAAGGFYSSSNDLSKLALSILNSTLLKPELTREWMKPITHTGGWNYSVGRPWEIYRFTQPVTQRISDLYTKGGDVANYDSNLIISPDHQAGFSILVETPLDSVPAIGSPVRTLLSDVVATKFLAALEAQAAAEAKSKFAGEYVSVDPKVNSSIRLHVDPTQGPGLTLSSWVENGTNSLALLSQAAGIAGGPVDLRLYPTDLKQQVAHQGSSDMTVQTRAAGNASAGAVEKQAFRAAITSPFPVNLGIFTSVCESWAEVDTLQYRKRGVDSFVFELDGSGNALTVTASGYFSKMKRVGA